MLAHRRAASVGGFGFRVLGGRGRARCRAPSVEDLGNVDDPASAFGNPQNEIVVLSAFEAWSEPAEFLDQCSAEHRQVVAVVLAPEALQRPVRLGEPVVLVPVDIDLGLVAVQEVHTGHSIDNRSDAIERIARQFVVMVEEHEELTRGEVDRSVGGTGDALVVRHVHHGDSWVLRQRRQRLQHGGILGPVVRDQPVPIAVRLTQNRLGARVEMVGIRIEDRRDDRERRVHRSDNSGSGGLAPQPDWGEEKLTNPEAGR